MYCPSCGTQNPEGASYCVKCGKHIDKNQGNIIQLEQGEALSPNRTSAEASPANTCSQPQSVPPLNQRGVSTWMKFAIGFIVFCVILAIVGVILDPAGTQEASSSTRTSTPSTSTITRTQATASAMAAMGTALNAVNSASEQQFFSSWRIKESGGRFEVTVSDVWYALPTFQKERFIEQVADIYAGAAAQNGLRGSNPDAGNYPTTSFVDGFGKEVAYKSTFRTKVVE